MSLEDKLREFVRAEARAVFDEMRRESPPSPTLDDRFLSVKEAATISGYKPQTLRKWLCQKKLRNYGRHGSPRVRLSEIVNLNRR